MITIYRRRRLMARFEVPGGHIDVTRTSDGSLRVHGVNVTGDYSSQLTIHPESGNDITVSLTEIPPVEGDPGLPACDCYVIRLKEVMPDA